jgi:catechol 2,3-dioxygenase-like lactoylglutathione lyase family enzyme
VTPAVWYRVRDLDVARRFYAETLGFEVTSLDETEGWMNLRHGEMEIALMRGEPVEDGGVAPRDGAAGKAEAERLREAGVEVGVVFELHGEIRLVDVFDPDGNRIQLAQDVGEQPEQ